MVHSVISKWLEDPFKEISRIFERKYMNYDKIDNISSFDVERYFLDVFNSDLEFEKIPSLEEMLNETVSSGKLVKMTCMGILMCMIQDTNFGQEICMGAYKVDGKGWVFSRYDLLTPERTTLDPSDPTILLDERQCLYATSIPGESKWLNQDLVNKLNALSLHTSSDTYISERFPLKDQKHLAVILKTYAGMETQFNVCNVVDVVGILEKDTETIQEYMANDQYIRLQLPIIHVIHMKTINLNKLVTRTLGIMKEDDILKIRTDIINYLATIFCNDSLVAEFLLLSLVSNVSSRLPSMVLGSFPINIRNCSSNIFSEFKEFLKNVLPASICEKINISNLNNNKFYPLNDGEKLQAGIMQLAKGTTVCFDETSMNEGTLNDTGVRNIRSLSQVVISQVLPFYFSFSEFEIETDLTIIILSKNGKTLLPIDISIPIKSQTLVNSVSSLCITSDKLLEFRKYFATTRQLFVTISNEISEKIQSDFVQQRQLGNKISEKEFGLRISVAKLFAKTCGSNTVSWDHWENAVRLISSLKALK
ncbi:hypothetical protein PORY_002660 [Pneumocystis oryctolagi]|uniref:Uncharacterized protein n=1 Tax=Pneumocystis oryctolagi TaxID=42067 RepID=A0ACB7C8F4_9ASCO|nr:hypothetical protein PORY_002660 [Pneumocystis oryctolagi]